MGEEKYYFKNLFLAIKCIQWSYSYGKSFINTQGKNQGQLAVWLIFNLRERGFYQIFTFTLADMRRGFFSEASWLYRCTSMQFLQNNKNAN